MTSEAHQRWKERRAEEHARQRRRDAKIAELERRFAELDRRVETLESGLRKTYSALQDELSRLRCDLVQRQQRFTIDPNDMPGGRSEAPPTAVADELLKEEGS